MAAWGQEGGRGGYSQPGEISILIKIVNFLRTKIIKQVRKHKLSCHKKMEPSHVFYKELPLDESNIFFANLAENNEIK